MSLLSKIGVMVRSGLSSRPRRGNARGKVGSVTQLDAELGKIKKALVKSAVREEGLKTDLAFAEQEGREQDVSRIQRKLAELQHSSDALLAALDLIEAQIEFAKDKRETGSVSTGDVFLGKKASERIAWAGNNLPDEDLSQTPELDAEDDPDLADRKTRLSGSGPR